MRSDPLSDNAGFLEGEVSLSVIHGLSDDHMIQELDLKNPGSFINPTGQPHISFARLCVARRVIVLCGHNDLCDPMSESADATEGLGAVRIDQTLHIILCAFLCAPSVM